MSDRLATPWPPTIRNPLARTRRRTLGLAILTPLLAAGGLGSIPRAHRRIAAMAACRRRQPDQVTRALVQGGMRRTWCR